MGYHREIDFSVDGLDVTSSKGAGAIDQREQEVSYDVSSDVSPSLNAGELLLARGDFQIRLADGCGRKNSDALIDRMYSWRGYKPNTHDAPVHDADEITLQACRDASVFGTLTIRFDSNKGLAADALYREEIDAYRNTGARVAELTRLAVDPELGSKEVLGALFHLAYVCTGPVRDVGDVFIEVNPRHAGFYRRMLNFRPAGECKICPRVDAPAVLLRVEVAYVGEQAALFGGRPAGRKRSLYPYFCSAQEEQGVMQRIFDFGWRKTTPDVGPLARLEPHALVVRSSAEGEALLV